MSLKITYGGLSGNLKIPSKFKEVVREIGFEERKQLGEICFIFVSEKEILGINRKFLKHDYITDVITFSNNMKLSVAGDIYISPDVVFHNAMIYKSDKYTELFRVMIHGVLHLVGFRDGTTDERSNMREKEDYYLEFGRSGNYFN